MNVPENNLAEKTIKQQELESEIRDAEFQLCIIKYEINNLKDEMILEYAEQLDQLKENQE